MQNLLYSQKTLQKKAHKILDNLDLKNLFSKYGEFKIVGSLDYGLMTWGDIDDENNIWKFDIRILKKEDVTSDKTALLIKKMTTENRLNILEIKSQVHDDPDYHKKFSSVDIYEAVINN